MPFSSSFFPQSEGPAIFNGTDGNDTFHETENSSVNSTAGPH